MENYQRLIAESLFCDLFSKMTEDISIDFYQNLFTLNPKLQTIFNVGNEQRKNIFEHILMLLSDLNNIERNVDEYRFIKSSEIDFQSNTEDYTHYLTALTLTFEDHIHELSQEQNDAISYIWEKILEKVILPIDEHGIPRPSNSALEETSHRKVPTLYNDDLLTVVGGRSKVLAVYQHFYNDIFEHPWLGKFFWAKSKSLLISKRTDFMCQCMEQEGRPHIAPPTTVHKHMYITDEQFDLYQGLLLQAMQKESLSDVAIHRWQTIDEMFRPHIVKKSIEACEVSCFGQHPIVSAKPLSQ